MVAQWSFGAKIGALHCLPSISSRPESLAICEEDDGVLDDADKVALWWLLLCCSDIFLNNYARF